MDVILRLISNYGERFIIFMFVIVLIALLANGVILSNHKSRIKENLMMDGSIYAINMEEKKIEEVENEKIEITPNTIRNYEAKFNAACAFHNVLAQFIPLFPLFGILGTVAGLMLMVNQNAADAMKQLLDGLNSALGTTLYGLFAVIFLKFTDAVFPSRIIGDVDVLLDDFDKKLELARTFKQ